MNKFIQRKPYPEDWRSQDLGSKGQPSCMSEAGHCGGSKHYFLVHSYKLVTNEDKYMAFNDS
jgi:hypothetical protein